MNCRSVCRIFISREATGISMTVKKNDNKQRRSTTGSKKRTSKDCLKKPASAPLVIESPSEILNECIREFVEGSDDDSTADDFILSRMSKYPPLEPKEELRLFHLIKKKNCKKSREIMLMHNMRWVAKIAKNYRNKGLDYADLFQEGVLGLDHAIDKFDYRKGFKFSTYATWWIKESITRAIKMTSLPIRLPVKVFDTSAKVKQLHQQCCIEEHRTPTSLEIAEKLGITQEEAQKHKGYLYEYDSLHRKIYNDDALGDIIKDERQESMDELAMQGEDYRYLYDCLQHMPAKMAAFLRRFYGLRTGRPRTKVEMAMLYDISEQQVMARCKRALRRLKSLIDPARINLEGGLKKNMEVEESSPSLTLVAM